MPDHDLELFRQLVLRDPTLLAKLREAPELFAFIDLMVRLGAERGYHFTAEAVRQALSESRRAWRERWP